MNGVEDQGRGQRLLTAVERIIADTDSLIALAEETLQRARERELESEADTRELAAAEVVNHFALRAALAGGLAATPALIPGAGSVVAVLGGTLADMGFLLKYEVEMALVLSHLHGFDIRQDEERQLAFLLASVGTYDARSGRSVLVDMAEAESIAIRKYTPREVSKMLVGVMTRITLLRVSRGLVRALPLVGIVVGSSMNKFLTMQVGERCVRDLKLRRELTRQRAEPEAAAAAPASRRVRKPAKKKSARRGAGEGPRS